jgi:transposase
MKTDGRHLTPEVQEERRRQVVHAVVAQGMSQVQAVRVFGAGRTSIHHWVKAYRQGGLAALRARKRGPKPRSRLAGHQAATLVRMIEDRCPDQLHLPFALWTREAVRQLIARRCGLHVSVWTVGRYLRHWGFTPQKPLRRAYEQDPAAVRHWLETEYPAIRRQAKAEKAEIHWGDEMGMRSDHQVGTSYGRRGRTPTIPGTGQRFGCNMISAITNRGRLVFMIFKCRFTGPVFLTFLKRLVRQLGRKAFLIVDGHPVHRAAAVKRWAAEHARQLRLFYLPGYSPKLNPDELLNQDVKSNAVGRLRPQNREELVSTVRSYLHSTQKRPDIVQSYFLQEDVRYAAI